MIIVGVIIGLILGLFFAPRIDQLKLKNAYLKGYASGEKKWKLRVDELRTRNLALNFKLANIEAKKKNHG